MGTCVVLEIMAKFKAGKHFISRQDAVAQRSADTYRDLEKDLNLEVVWVLRFNLEG